MSQESSKISVQNGNDHVQKPCLSQQNDVKQLRYWLRLQDVQTSMKCRVRISILNQLKSSSNCVGQESLKLIPININNRDLDPEIYYKEKLDRLRTKLLEPKIDEDDEWAEEAHKSHLYLVSNYGCIKDKKPEKSAEVLPHIQVEDELKIDSESDSDQSDTLSPILKPDERKSERTLPQFASNQEVVIQKDESSRQADEIDLILTNQQESSIIKIASRPAQHLMPGLSDSILQNDSHLLSLTISQILTDEKSNNNILSQRQAYVFEYEEANAQNQNTIRSNNGQQSFTQFMKDQETLQRQISRRTSGSWDRKPIPKKPLQIPRPLLISSKEQKIGEQRSKKLPKVAVQKLFKNLQFLDKQIENLENPQTSRLSLDDRFSQMDKDYDSRSICSQKSRSRSRSQSSFYNYASYQQRNDSKSKRNSSNNLQRPNINPRLSINFERSASSGLPAYPQISTKQKEQGSREVQAPSIIRKKPMTSTNLKVSDFNEIKDEQIGNQKKKDTLSRSEKIKSSLSQSRLLSQFPIPVKSDEFQKIANFYGTFSKTFIDSDRDNRIPQIVSMDTSRLSPLQKDKTIQNEIDLTSVHSGNSTDSNSPKIKHIKAPKKLQTNQHNTLTVKIIQCAPKKQSPFVDDRLDKLADSKKISNYKREMKSLFKEVNLKDRSLSYERTGMSQASVSNMSTQRIGINHFANTNVINPYTKRGENMPVRAVHNMEKIPLVNNVHRSKHIFEGNSPFIEMNFNTTINNQQTKRRRVISSNENKNSLHIKLRKQQSTKQKK